MRHGVETSVGCGAWMAKLLGAATDTRVAAQRNCRLRLQGSMPAEMAGITSPKTIRCYQCSIIRASVKDALGCAYLLDLALSLL